MNCLFFKYNINGNIIVLVQKNEKLVSNYQKFSKRILDPVFGVGGDGLIVYDNDIFKIDYFNQDGSKALFCGNGLRAYVDYLSYHKPSFNGTYPVLFGNHVYTNFLNRSDKTISTIIPLDYVDLRIPSYYNDFSTNVILPIRIKLLEKELEIYPIKIGVLHLVVINNTKELNNHYLNEEKLEVLKEDLKNRFIEEFNITIIRINNNQVKEFTFYERGVGYTLNCGSGTLCGAYILYLKGLLKNNRLCLNDDLVFEITSKELIITGVSKLLCWGKYNE